MTTKDQIRMRLHPVPNLQAERHHRVTLMQRQEVEQLRRQRSQILQAMQQPQTNLGGTQLLVSMKGES